MAFSLWVSLLFFLFLLIASPAVSSPAPAVDIYFFQRGYVEGGASPATTLTDAAVKAFTADHPEITVHVIGVPWGKEGDLKLRSALLARRRIDLFRLPHDQLRGFIPRRGRLLSPIDPYLTPADRADFTPQALEAVTFNGETMAWPLWSTALTLIARPEVLEQCGIAPPAGRPWTWAEFTNALKKVQGRKGPGGPLWGLTAAARPPLFEWAPLLMAHCGPLFTPGGRVAGDGTLPLASGLAAALGKVRELREAGLTAPGFGVDDDTAARNDFLSGRVAFLLTSPGFFKDLTAKKIPFLVLPPPTGDWGRPITTGALGCIAVVDSGDPARVQAAHTLARFLTSVEIARAVPGWYLAPPARASITSFYDAPAYRPLKAILPMVRFLNPPVASSFMEGAILPRLQAALLGEETPEAALGAIQRAARRQMLK